MDILKVYLLFTLITILKLYIKIWIYLMGRMPRVRKVKRIRRNRNRYKNRKIRGFDKSIIQYAPTGGIARKLATNLVYHDYHYSRNHIVDSDYDWTFRINGLYDPNYSATLGRNVQPSGRDLMISQYSFYQVKAVKITAMVALDTEGQTNAANLIKWSGAPYLTEDGSSIPNPGNELGEMFMGKNGVTTSFNGVKNRISWYVDFRRLTGQFGKGAFSSGLGCIAGNNPGQAIWFTLRIRPLGDVNHYLNVYRDIKIKYYVVFTGPKTESLDDAA